MIPTRAATAAGRSERAAAARRRPERRSGHQRRRWIQLRRSPRLGGVRRFPPRLRLGAAQQDDRAAADARAAAAGSQRHPHRARAGWTKSSTPVPKPTTPRPRSGWARTWVSSSCRTPARGSTRTATPLNANGIIRQRVVLRGQVQRSVQAERPDLDGRDRLARGARPTPDRRSAGSWCGSGRRTTRWTRARPRRWPSRSSPGARRRRPAPAPGAPGSGRSGPGSTRSRSPGARLRLQRRRPSSGPGPAPAPGGPKSSPTAHTERHRRCTAVSSRPYALRKRVYRNDGPAARWALPAMQGDPHGRHGSYRILGL